jgi:hypothetical protein
VAGAIGILFAPLVAIPYGLLTFLLGARATRLPLCWWPIIPLAFAAHHAVYWFGIVTGMLGATSRQN